MIRRTKADRREAKRRKARYGPTGGTRAGQFAHARIARGYRGDVKNFVRKK